MSFMLYEKIDRGYLNRHLHRVQLLDNLGSLKYQILNSCGLKAYDYSKIKVTAGNGHRVTDQEKAAIRVEKIDKEVKELEVIVKPEQIELNKQIERVDSLSNDYRHAAILRQLYIDGDSIKDVILNFYETDSKEARKSIAGLRKTAEKLLAKISTTPFIKVEQMIIEDWK
jgi:hypothetical protein